MLTINLTNMKRIVVPKELNFCGASSNWFTFKSLEDADLFREFCDKNSIPTTFYKEDLTLVLDADVTPYYEYGEPEKWSILVITV